MATLHGLSPAPVESCRVLEVACGDGANLIPMAYAAPGAEFVGFDLANAPIERGQRRIEELGLRNIRLFQADMLDLGPDLGQFDYIVAHGFYSWVPEPARDHMLAICGQLLAENGVAFVSYNTMPGGHMRVMVREMMLAGGESTDDPTEQVAEGLRFVRFICDARPDDDPFRALVESHLTRMEQRPLGSTRHDELSGAFEPVSFLDFVHHAGRHGLQYLCEAEIPPPGDPCYKGEIHAELERMAQGDELKKEQLLDYARMRGFRETLLCRGSQTVRREFAVEQLRRLSLASQAVVETGQAAGAMAFVLPGGARMESNHGGVTALLRALSAAWPRAVAFRDLEPLLTGTGLGLEEGGGAMLIRLLIAKMIELRAWSPPLAGEIGERPRASACSRQEIELRGRATTLLHTTAMFEDAKARCMLRLMDGTRDRNSLVAAMSREFPDEEPGEIAAGIERGLPFFARAGMLEL